jgi:hypothetical protein
MAMVGGNAFRDENVLIEAGSRSLTIVPNSRRSLPAGVCFPWHMVVEFASVAKVTRHA